MKQQFLVHASGIERFRYVAYPVQNCYNVMDVKCISVATCFEELHTQKSISCFSRYWRRSDIWKHKMWAAYSCTSQNLFAIDDSFKHRLWMLSCYRISQLFWNINVENPLSGLPFGLENPGKWEGIFQSGKSQGILNRLEKSGKMTQTTGKFREFQTNIICYILVIFKCTVYYLLKWIKFSVKKQNFKNILEKWEKILDKNTFQ